MSFFFFLPSSPFRSKIEAFLCFVYAACHKTRWPWRDWNWIASSRAQLRCVKNWKILLRMKKIPLRFALRGGSGWIGKSMLSTQSHYSNRWKLFHSHRRAAHGHRALFILILSGDLSREIETLFFMLCSSQKQVTLWKWSVHIMCK